MIYHVLTLFPELIESYFAHSIVKRAREKGVIELLNYNIRDYTRNKHKKVDDYPYGGGAGMVMEVEPVYLAYQAAKKNAPAAKCIYLTPQGVPYNQEIAKVLSKEKDIIFLCGHYEGVDERAIQLIRPMEISLGDFVLTGGELGALAVMDSVTRLLPGALNKAESFQEESFENSLLEYPQYTRPEVFLDKKVPEVLLSGHHKNIADFRRRQSIIRTRQKRPDLLRQADLTPQEQTFLKQWEENPEGGFQE